MLLDDRKYVSCECSQHVLVVDKLFDDAPHVIALAIWKDDYTSDWRGLWRRLKDLWQLAVTGKVLIDEVILEAPRARELGEYLINLLDDDG